MSKKDTAKEFLGNWYLIENAKNWLGLHLTFNQCDEIRGLFRGSSRAPGVDDEQHLENVLIEFDKKRKVELAEED